MCAIWHEANLDTCFYNVRFRAAEMPAFAAGMGAKRARCRFGGFWPQADGLLWNYRAAKRTQTVGRRFGQLLT